jgi:type II secretory pathway component PulM
VKISARERKFLIVGGCVCAAIVGWYLVTTLIPSTEDLSSALELSKKKLLRQKETLQQEEEYKARVAQYQERLNQDYQRLLPFNNPSIASAELQKVLSDLATKAGVDITQKNIQKEQKLQDDLTKVSVNIQTNCNPQQLVAFLAAIENYEKFLTLDELTINGYPIQRRFEIRPSMTVSGFIAAPESKAAEKPAAGK